MFIKQGSGFYTIQASTARERWAGSEYGYPIQVRRWGIGGGARVPVVQSSFLFGHFCYLIIRRLCRWPPRTRAASCHGSWCASPPVTTARPHVGRAQERAKGGNGSDVASYVCCGGSKAHIAGPHTEQAGPVQPSKSNFITLASCGPKSFCRALSRREDARVNGRGGSEPDIAPMYASPEPHPKGAGCRCIHRTISYHT